MTTETKHTPGPWAMPDSGQGRISKVGSNGGWDGLVAIADCGDYARSRSEGLANARLISAAPELLQALNAMLTYFGMDEDESSKPTFNKARTAIAKATGETQ